MSSRLCETLEDRVLLAAQAYDWNNVTIKGTGFSDGIVFSPAQQGLAYMNTDMGGAYRWDTSVNKWVPLTDWITNNDSQWGIKYNGAETVAADPTDAGRVYVGLGTYMGGNGAILRSSDQGRTWLRSNVPFGMDGNGSGRNSGQRMMVDPNSPNLLFYATRNSGIWKSSDYGATWSRLTGYSFTTDSSGAGQNVGTDWLLIDKSSGTPGSASQVIYAGAATTGNNKIWRSSDGGATWTAITGQPAGSTLYTVRGALTPDGSTLYLTYGVGDVGIGPNGQSNGYVYKVLNPKNSSPTWTALTIDSPHGQGGWSGITIDPNNPNTLFLSTMDRWWPTDEIYRSTNGGASWTALNAQANRDNSSSGWASSVGIHWVGDIQIDPFNANNVMFTTGFGILKSSNALAATPTWSFFCDGFEQSAVAELASPNTGTVNLFSAIGDRDGFRHADFGVSPPRLGQSQGLATGANEDIDVAWNNANYIVRLTRTSPYIQYSNDNGVTWAWMSSTGVTGSTGGNLAISADGTRVVWEQGGTARVIYATRSGSTWSSWSAPASNQPADGSKVVADLVSSTTFYAYVGTTLSRSTDGGANWTVMTSSAPSGGQWIRAVPGNAGHLLLSTGGGGLWRSTNGGGTWTRINSSAVTEAYELGVGMAAPGQSYPAMFVMGAVNGISGFFRSDNQGATWTMISDLAHEYGDVTVIQGDPRVYGRLYVGTNGRGILYADIHTPPATLPGGWSTQDIGSPGSAGSSGSPSTGSWEVTGGGAGITGTSDQFRFAYTTLTGDGTITARVLGVPNCSPANNNALAGVMIRNDLTAGSAQVLMAMSPGSVNGAVLKYRSATGGSTSTANAAGVWNPYWVRLTRVGNVFTAYRSADGVTWTQVGTAQTIPMGTSVYIGLAATAADNNQLNVSSFDNVSVSVGTAVGIFTNSQDIGSPSLAGSAAYDPSTGTYTVAGSGADLGSTSDQFRFVSRGFSGDGSIIARVTGVQNTNAGARAAVMLRDSTAANAMFAAVAVSYSSGLSFQWRASTGGSSTAVQIPGIAAPAWVKLIRSGNAFAAFYATTTGTPASSDWVQIGTAQTIPMSSIAQIGLAVTSHNTSLLCTSSFTGVQIIASPSVATPAAATPNPANGTTTNLSVLGAEDGGESGLTYTWAMTSGPAPVTFSANGTNAAKTTTATFTQAGTYTFQVTIADAGGRSVTSSVSVPVSFGAFSSALDIGSPGAVGSSSYDPSTGTYTVTGGGADIWNTSDQFHFLSKAFSGDGAITARVTGVQNTDTWAKAGVMLRSSTAADSAFADVVVTPGQGVSFQWRATTGGNCGYAQVWGIAAPAWVQLARTGDSFSASYATTPSTPASSDWIPIGSPVTISMPPLIQAGLAVTSHNPSATSTATFTNVSVNDSLPAVTSVSVNDGAAQRSMVNKLSVTFSEPVTLSPTALTIKLSTGQSVPNTTITLTNPSADQRTYLLTFSGSAILGGSLADGIYDLVVTAPSVQDLAGTAMTADLSQRFHRLFGDSDGNKIVNALDYARLKQSFGRAPSDPLFNSALDYEANGLINALDLARFRQRYGLSFSY